MQSEAENKENIESPFTPKMVEITVPHPLENKDFDLDKYQYDVTAKALNSIFKIIGEEADTLSFNKGNDTVETVTEKLNMVAKKFQDSLIDNEVPDCAMQDILDTIQTIMTQIFGIITRQKNEFQKELLARVIGTRNPKEGRYDRGYATLGDMFLALKRVKAEQGDNAEDYYPLKKMVPVDETATAQE